MEKSIIIKDNKEKFIIDLDTKAVIEHWQISKLDIISSIIVKYYDDFGYLVFVDYNGQVIDRVGEQVIETKTKIKNNTKTVYLTLKLELENHREIIIKQRDVKTFKGSALIDHFIYETLVDDKTNQDITNIDYPDHSDDSEMYGDFD